MKYEYVSRSGPNDLFGNSDAAVRAEGAMSSVPETRGIYSPSPPGPPPRMLGITRAAKRRSGMDEELSLTRALESRSDYWARSSSKFAAELMELIQMKEKPKDFSKGAVQVKDGLVLVQVWVTRLTDEIIDSLKKKGLEMSFEASTGKMVVGLIKLDKLEGLAEIEDVRLIEPFTTG